MDLTDRIFYAAAEEFKDNGLKFTMDSLAARLGISKRTLYETVSSKEQVVELVIDKTFANIKEQQKPIFEETEKPMIERIKKLLSIIPAYADVLDFRRVNEIKKGYPALYDKIQEKIENDWEPTLQLLSEAMEQKIIKETNLMILKELLCSVFEKLLDGKYLIQNNITYEEALNQTVEIIFHGILV